MSKQNKRYKNKDMANLLLGRKGGRTTVRIIDQILEHPYNTNQLSNELNLDYNTIKYHINLILKSDLVMQGEVKYGGLFYPTDKLINNLNEYEDIKEYLNKNGM